MFQVFTGQGDARHGCATFYRRTRFTEVKHYKIAFRDYGKKFLDWQKRPEQFRRLLQDNVAVVSILRFVGETVVSGDPVVSDDPVSPVSRVYSLCVANTHITSDPKYTDVKLWQVAVLLDAIENIAYPDVPVLFCWDLNSRPGSAPYELIMNGYIPSHLWPEDPTFVVAHTYQNGVLARGYIFHRLKLVVMR
ncbi:hypothetical protein AQUCO_00800119v1 [Aquilegia coerulea]|uniref:Uncharacterized protein n=1 Tax=Aquilegia coerulea TaxID=218851 RepID=A0A2G5EHB8_AQUCA|nr:hypothetical protein AQUCO_00800119v1 [Aquilegia coerulea]